MSGEGPTAGAPLKTTPIHTLAYRRMVASLRGAREEAGLTQAEVGAYFGRPQSFVSKCESAERRIDPTELWRFAKLYRKPVSYFLDDSAELTAESTVGHTAPPGAVLDERAIHGLWKRLESLDYQAQIAAVEGDERHHTRRFCRCLQRISQVMSQIDPDVGLQYANLAMRVSFHLGASCDPVSLRDLRALAFAYLGDARRTVGELRSAGDAFDAARTLRARGTGDPWVEAEIIGLEAQLPLEQHRLTEAVTLLDRLLATYADSSTAQPAGVIPRGPVNALVTKAWCLYHLGEREAAQGLLEEAEQKVEASGERELMLPILSGLLWCAITCGKFAAAQTRLAAAIRAADDHQDPAVRPRLRRAEARIALALGERAAAEHALRETAADLARLMRGTDAALAWLALAKLELEEGARRVTLERTVGKLVPALISEAGREQLLELFLFVSSCTQGKLTSEAVTQFARALEETRRPSLGWWSEWGTVLGREGSCDAASQRVG
jgi:transcriptional regulator with XRE-family HTH domain